MLSVVIALRSCLACPQALLAALLSLVGGGGYFWHARQQAAAGSSHQQSLDEIRTNYDEQEGQAYQDLGEMDPDLQQQQEPAAARAGAAAVAAVGAAAADALAAGVGMASRVLTPRVKVHAAAAAVFVAAERLCCWAFERGCRPGMCPPGSCHSVACV
jgi:hypothetical protein